MIIDTIRGHVVAVPFIRGGAPRKHKEGEQYYGRSAGHFFTFTRPWLS